MKKNIEAQALKLHEKHRGKTAVVSKVPLRSKKDLSLAYTPGVAAACLKVAADPSAAYRYTAKWNSVAVVTDGTAVLGLGDIGALAGLPVMEGKAILFKEFGGVDAFPICIESKDPDDICRTVELISPGFGGINLEDISSPRCFEIERRLKKSLSIPVFHDDQHGTAVVVLAALVNALKLTDRTMRNVSVVICGAGAAGIAIARFLHNAGCRRLVLCDREGAVYPGRPSNMNAAKADICSILSSTGPATLAESLRGADCFVGVSGPDIVTGDMVAAMADRAIVFAMSNPVPEIMPEEAVKAGAAVVGTGRSDFPNQINNLLAFPGIFRGALDARAREITEEMKKAAAYAIAGYVADRDLEPGRIIPSPLDKKVARAVAKAVRKAAPKPTP